MKITVKDVEKSLVWCNRLDCKFCGEFCTCSKEEIEIDKDGCKSYEMKEK